MIVGESLCDEVMVIIQSCEELIEITNFDFNSGNWNIPRIIYLYYNIRI